ncbi:hypothetical protein [Burkholderia gladioli]|uniref:hypothetical protein n=1 Tax=Burkholderia gladioli TaxID=28095 RepID=UPI000CFEB74D|nr:hypothetical protein [Burkholderia gladioli]PRE88291.1 hypothetical protein C6Q13_11090 [Burkholderia gladioli]
MTIQFLPRITVELSADAWDLYDNPGRDEAARTLSTAAAEALTQAWALMAGLHPVSIIDAHRYALERSNGRRWPTAWTAWARPTRNPVR